mmetsp:Transcript_38984/g.97995  ORF Transcript_38984/g.97995 Transcript_38984/m.97995 type:complete len:462 (-) Transcript_38984:86-1471(-)
MGCGASVSKHFPGCWIPETAMRGICLAQLRKVLAEIEKRCPEEGWVAGGGPKVGQPISAHEVNLYDTMTKVIMPATKPYECSYVELIAKGPQKPRYFVSHWWGEPVVLFIRCLTMHAEDRGFDESTFYWVCAYANNQYKLMGAVTADPTGSAFYQAIRESDGVVSVVDENGICFTRVWCVFEVWCALAGEVKKDFKYDIYTAKEHNIWGRTRYAVGLVHGAALHDPRCGQREEGALEFGGYKVQREGKFPMGLLEKAVAINLEQGEATVEEDRRHILNCIAGRKAEELDLDPFSTHESYRKVNDLLRSKVALDTLASGLKAEDHVFETYMDALSNAERTHLFLDIPQGLSKERQEKLIDSLPTSLVSMVMRGIVHIPSSFGKLNKLKDLNLSQSRQLEALPDSIGNMAALEGVNLVNCESLKALPEQMLKLSNLKALNLGGCKSLGDLPDFSKLTDLTVVR